MSESNAFSFYNSLDVDGDSFFTNISYLDYIDDSSHQKIIYDTGISVQDYIKEKYTTEQSSYGLLKSKRFQEKKLDSENQNIYETAEEFKDAAVENFQKCIALEDLEFGVVGETTRQVEKLLAINKDYTVNAITQLALDDFGNTDLVYSVLHTLAHVDYNLIAPGGAMFALTASRHKNIEIQDLSIQCFDMWESKESLEFLKVIRISTPWLNDYLQEVISNIENANV